MPHAIAGKLPGTGPGHPNIGLVDAIHVIGRWGIARLFLLSAGFLIHRHSGCTPEESPRMKLTSSDAAFIEIVALVTICVGWAAFVFPQFEADFVQLLGSNNFSHLNYLETIEK